MSVVPDRGSRDGGAVTEAIYESFYRQHPILAGVARRLGVGVVEKGAGAARKVGEMGRGLVDADPSPTATPRDDGPTSPAPESKEPGQGPTATTHGEVGPATRGDTAPAGAPPRAPEAEVEVAGTVVPPAEMRRKTASVIEREAQAAARAEGGPSATRVRGR